MIKEEMVSNKFRNLGFVAACLVVFIHLGPNEHCAGSAWWFSKLMTESICQMAVPFFFFTSGYFLYKRVGCDNWYEAAVLKRTKTVLLPYLLWCAFYVLFSNSLQFVANIVAHRPVLDNVWVTTDWITWLGFDMGRAPFFTPMWFLRSLFILVLASPVFVVCKRHLPMFAFLLLAFVFEKYYFRGVFYFAAGMCFCGHEKDVGSRMGLVFGLLATLALVAKVVLLKSNLVWPSLAQEFLVIALIAAAWSVIPSANLPSVLTGNAFPLYLLHWPVLCIYCIFVPNAIALSSASQMLAKGLVGIGVSLTAAILLRKVLPRFSSICFGGR